MADRGYLDPHTEDFVVCHVPLVSLAPLVPVAPPSILQAVTVCARNPKNHLNPEYGSFITVYVYNGTGVPTVSHDLRITANSGPVWLAIGSFQINRLYWWTYTLGVSASIRQMLGQRSEYYIAVELTLGEIIDSYDQNVDIAWIDIWSGAPE